ncbi:sugar ABC transporter permease [Ruminococcus sp. HUN007]|uniref:carbohydrate ABC transporter permease n=1 Tax=Ruminococcus sp. HUN007 TaxID=1514668 RepID=UPI000A4F090F|nr:sugar ABC transporter permease [Ruminococcus sp. HUN007]
MKPEKNKKKRSYNRSESIECWLMLAPFLAFFVLFTVIPVLISLPVGFTDFDMINMPHFTGLSNFKNLFLSDRIFIRSIRTTLIFAIFSGPVSYVLCFMLAWLINELPKRLKTVFTLIFYIPSMASVYTVWQLIFSGDQYGYVNSVLMDLGILTSARQWLTDSRYILFVVILVQLWISLGAGFLALRAGFQNIDKSLYEAGAVEGIKSRWQELVYITIPAMKPQMLFAAVMQIVAAFTADIVGRNLVGFPSTDYAAHTVMTHAYDYGWVRYEMGYSSAICTVLFLVMYGVNKLITRVLAEEDQV